MRTHTYIFFLFPEDLSFIIIYECNTYNLLVFHVVVSVVCSSMLCQHQACTMKHKELTNHWLDKWRHTLAICRLRHKRVRPLSLVGHVEMVGKLRWQTLTRQQKEVLGLAKPYKWKGMMVALCLVFSCVSFSQPLRIYKYQHFLNIVTWSLTILHDSIHSSVRMFSFIKSYTMNGTCMVTKN